MGLSHLPLELCELVIDCCSRVPGYPEGPQWVWASYCQLRSCSLTCKDWLPRARRNLYSTLILTDLPRYRRLAATLADHPHLAEFVTAIQISYSGKYIPFMLAGFVKALPRVRFLVFDTDATLYPPKYLALTAQYPITSLSIWDLSIFPSWSSLFDFIWAFPYLANLRIGSHIDGLPGEGTEEPLSILKASRLSAIANRGRCRQLRTLHLEDIWFLCPAFPPKGVFGCSLESLTLRVGERASSIETLGSRLLTASDPFCHLFQMPTLRTVEIAIVPKRLGLPSRILGRHTQSQALQVHKDMAEKLSNIVRLMRLSRCEVRELRIRFKLLPTRDGGVPLHFHHTYLFQQYFGSGLQEAVESLNSALSLQQLRICLPLNGLPPPCDTAAWWESQLRAHLTRLKVNVSVNLFRMYPSLDPDDSLPSTWYCHRHAGWVTLEMCSAACFAVPILKPGNPLA